ncbi:Xaa-Pro aminopeptidase 2, partial [Homalodisca vitripennis]
MPEWVSNRLKPGGRIGADPTLVSSAAWERWAKKLAENSVYLLPIRNNLVDFIWGSSQPSYSKHDAHVWPIEYAGKTWQEKVAAVRTMVEGHGCDAMVVTSLDEIAWLLNIRGRDIPFSPVLRAYVVLTKSQISMYVPPNKLDLSVQRQLRTDNCYSAFCVRLQNYTSIWEDLRTLSQVWKKVLLPAEDEFSQGVSRAIYTAIPVDKRHVAQSPIMTLKSEKNPTEKEGMRKAHIRDATAFCDFMAYLEDKMADGENWDELKVAHYLDKFRREQNLNRGISFRTIVAFGPHAAWPHYVPSNVTSLSVDRSSILLIDSGGHYLDGTTDVSRTFHLGSPSDREVDIYTRVLMGCIDLAMLQFPHYLPIRNIDVLARAHLWQAGVDYRHSTGHGVGVYGSVHESPININWQSKDAKMFRVGYFFTEEPGFYQEGQFGMRLENVLEVVQNNFNSTHGPFLSFRIITLIPFEPKLIDRSRLSPQQ